MKCCNWKVSDDVQSRDDDFDQRIIFLDFFPFSILSAPPGYSRNVDLLELVEHDGSSIDNTFGDELNQVINSSRYNQIDVTFLYVKWVKLQIKVAGVGQSV